MKISTPVPSRDESLNKSIFTEEIMNNLHDFLNKTSNGPRKQ